MRKGRSCKGRKSVWIMHKIAIFGKNVLFAAKQTAFCSKTQHYLQQNARQNAAKRKVKWCKMQGEMHQYTKQDASLCT